MGEGDEAGPDDAFATDGEGGGDGDGPSGTLRERIPVSWLKTWLLLAASRRLVAATLLAVLFAIFVVLGAVDPVGIRTAMGSKDPIETAFQGFLTAIITGVTLVVTINQLVLSQELGAVGDQRERMEGSLSFREDVEDALELSVAPADPADFLRAIIDATAERADALAAAATDRIDDERRDRIDAYVDDLVENARSASGELEGARFGTFEVVIAALDYNYSWKIHEARRLRNEFDVAGDAEGVDEALADLIEALELFGPAREHVKTLYFQWELIDLSRAVLYAAVPSLVVATSMILFVDDPGSVPGTTFGVDNLVWLVSGAVTVALTPFVILLAYILRIATVTKRTLAIGPFVLRETDHEGVFDSK